MSELEQIKEVLIEIVESLPDEELADGYYSGTYKRKLIERIREITPNT